MDLKALLNNSKLQAKDIALYNVILGIIEELEAPPIPITNYTQNLNIYKPSPRYEVQFLNNTDIGWFGQAIAHQTDMSWNLYFDGLNWNLFNTAQPGLVMVMDANGFTFFSATAGANPRTLTRLFRISSANNGLGSWVPVVTFATPGNLVVVYAIQVGYYSRVGDQVLASFLVQLSTFTHTTAAGALQITGLPFTSVNETNNFQYGSGQWSGITKAGFGDVNPRVAPNATLLNLVASGSAVNSALIAAADMPTGGTPVLGGTITYRAIF